MEQQELERPQELPRVQAPDQSVAAKYQHELDILDRKNAHELVVQRMENGRLVAIAKADAEIVKRSDELEFAELRLAEGTSEGEYRLKLRSQAIIGVLTASAIMGAAIPATGLALASALATVAAVGLAVLGAVATGVRVDSGFVRALRAGNSAPNQLSPEENTKQLPADLEPT